MVLYACDVCDIYYAIAASWVTRYIALPGTTGMPSHCQIILLSAKRGCHDFEQAETSGVLGSAAIFYGPRPVGGAKTVTGQAG